MTLSELSVSLRERADHRQVTLIELMEEDPGKMAMGEACH